jgi:7-cyano-7-deazaguanine synthase
MHLGKKEILLKGLALGVDYSLTHSCYDPQGDLACGRCDACRLRLRGFAAAGVADPVRYVQANGPTGEEQT